jgi:hypothetical protein
MYTETMSRDSLRVYGRTHIRLPTELGELLLSEKADGRDWEGEKGNCAAVTSDTGFCEAPGAPESELLFSAYMLFLVYGVLRRVYASEEFSFSTE